MHWKAGCAIRLAKVHNIGSGTRPVLNRLRQRAENSRTLMVG